MSTERIETWKDGKLVGTRSYTVPDPPQEVQDLQTLSAKVSSGGSLSGPETVQAMKAILLAWKSRNL